MSASKAPASRRKRSKQTLPVAVDPAPEAPALATPPSLAESARQSMIAEAAYYRAERRGFAPGNELDDWFAAEAEICSLEHAAQPTELH